LQKLLKLDKNVARNNAILTAKKELSAEIMAEKYVEKYCE
jgi:hypothetical protein